MRSLKRLALSAFIVALLITAGHITGSAQRRTTRVITTNPRPIAVRRVYYYRPYYYNSFWRGTLWDPYYYDPYFYDPYLRAQRDKYYKEKAVRDARRKLAKHREEYGYDGYLTEKERKKMEKDQRRYSKAVANLNKFYRTY
jgi:hypothetical protein